MACTGLVAEHEVQGDKRCGVPDQEEKPCHQDSLVRGSTFDWLCQLPIASCDTSSWAKAGVYGFITYWNPHEDSFNKSHRIYISGPVKPSKRNEYHFVTYPWRTELEDYLRNTFGYTYQKLCGYGDKYYMQVVNTRFYVELERRINEERRKNGIPLE